MTTTDAEIRDEIRKAKRRVKRRTTVSLYVVDVVAALIFGLIDGWMLMLAVEVAHDFWLRSLPTVGYWPAVAICWLLGAIVRPGRRKKKETDS